MERTLIQPTPPAVAGLSWRPASRDDLAPAVELAQACWQADGGLAFLNEPDNLAGRYFPDGLGAALGAWDDAGRLAAWATVHRMRRSGIELAAMAGQVRPDWRGRGLGGYLMAWSEAQAERLLVDLPAGQKRRQVATETLTGAADRLYRAYGFRPVMEEWVMRRDLLRPLPERPLPGEVTVATWQPELAEQFFQAYDGSFRDRPGFPGYTAEAWLGGWSEDETTRAAWSLLALAGERPVGFLTAATDEPGGFIIQVGVVPEMRRRGLGSALLVESMRRMAADGETAVQLTVALNNPAAFEAYTRLGFVTAGRRGRYERAT